MIDFQFELIIIFLFGVKFLKLKHIKCRSDWEETPKTYTVNSFQSLQLQFIGIIGVLLVILVMIVPVTIAIRSYKTTTIITSTVTTKITTSSIEHILIPF